MTYDHLKIFEIHLGWFDCGEWDEVCEYLQEDLTSDFESLHHSCSYSRVLSYQAATSPEEALELAALNSGYKDLDAMLSILNAGDEAFTLDAVDATDEELLEFGC